MTNFTTIEWDDNEQPPEGYGESVVLHRLADNEGDEQTLYARLGELCKTLNAKAPKGGHGVYTYTWDTPRKGQRFIRLVMEYTPTNGAAQRSVHAFVDSTTGDLLKSDGWKRPAKGIRGNLLDRLSFDAILNRCDWSGRYLYAR